MVWFDCITENEPMNLTLVKIKAVSFVDFGDKGFHGMSDLSPAYGSMISTSTWTFRTEAYDTRSDMSYTILLDDV